MMQNQGQAMKPITLGRAACYSRWGGDAQQAIISSRANPPLRHQPCTSGATHEAPPAVPNEPLRASAGVLVVIGQAVSRADRLPDRLTFFD